MIFAPLNFAYFNAYSKKVRASGPLALAAILAATAAAQPPGGLDAMAKTMAKGADAGRAMATMQRVYSTDRWFTFPKFEETALYLKQRLEESGVKDVEIGAGKADGRTQVGFWTMPLAWDARAARLEMVAPERSLLCDYQAVPTSLGMWSASTPKGGVTAEVVDIDSTPWTGVKGKFVLTSRNSAGYKDRLVKYGAIGAVNGFSENPALPDGRQWINAWGDSGWAFTKASTPLLSFSITPRQAGRLRQLLAAGKKVTLHAEADTRYYEGRYPWVTGVIPGADASEEVLVLGHTSEQGAQDNATGVSAMVEALHTIGRLVRSGTLPPPKRTIRVLLAPEMYGALSYISAHETRMKRTVAALTIDTPAASYDLAGTEYTFYMNPHAAMSYTDALLLRIGEAVLSPRRPWHWKEFTPGTDSYLGEPTIGVPDDWIYSGTGVETHHNSEDKPETVDPRSLHDLTAMIATYLYFNASAGEAQSQWLAEITLDRCLEQMQSAAATAMDAALSGKAKEASYGLERVSYLAERGEQAVLSVLRIVPADRRDAMRGRLDAALRQIDGFRDLQSARLKAAGVAAPDAAPDSDAARIVVRRKRMGTIPLDDLPQDQWEGFPSGAWNKRVSIALYWCDGKRTLAEVKHLTEMEMGPTEFDFAAYFRFLAKHGYVELGK
jgi:hypothetical protein